MMSRSRTPVQFQGVTSISSPMEKGSLNFPAKKKEAARIDQDNMKFAMRILNQKPQVDHYDDLQASHRKNMRTLQMISSKSRVTMN